MNRIIPPLRSRMQGPMVADLQDGLQLLLNRGVLLADDEGLRRELSAALRNERAEQTFGSATGKLVDRFQMGRHLQTSGMVDEPTAGALNRLLEDLGAIDPGVAYKVHGRVTQGDQIALPGVSVRAFACGIRGETALGDEATTDRAGRYAITYTVPRGQAPPALLVRAFDPERPDEPLAESRLVVEPPPELTVDLEIGADRRRAPSEFERLGEQLEPLLAGTSIAELGGAELAYLALGHEIEPEQLAAFAQAARLATTTGVAAPALYGLFRKDLPLDLHALLAQQPDVRRAALHAAVAENVIPLGFDGPEHVAAVERAAVPAGATALLDRPLAATRASLREVLATVTEDPDLQEAFAAACVAHAGTAAQFWTSLRGDDMLADHVAEIQVTLQLGAIAGGHLPLVRELQRRRDTGEFADVSELARLSSREWQQLIARGEVGAPEDVAGEDAEDRQRHYATAITHLLEDSFPTTFVAARIADSELEGKEDLGSFLARNPEFKLEGGRLATYLAEHGEAEAFAAIPTERRAKVRAQLEGMQRLQRVVPRVSQAIPLLQNGLSSAQGITRLGPTVFQNQFADVLGGHAAARTTYEHAEQVAGTAINLLADYGLAAGKLGLAAVPSGAVTDDTAIPDLRTLFGSLELCECEHCRSVYSPAAYLVDILHFLADRKLVDTSTITYRDEQQPDGSKLEVLDLGSLGYTSGSAVDVLLKRRPDIAEIELTCDNTNIPLPYVDIVNEVLEEAVAPLPAFSPLQLTTTAQETAALQDELNQRTVSTTLSQAFAQHQLSPHAEIVVEKPDEAWRVEDLPRSYAIRMQSGHLWVVRCGRQTRGSAQERSANPQYMIAAAYRTLARQVSPLGYRNPLFAETASTSLPFNFWFEEVRAYLRHLGVERHELMEVLLPGDRDSLLKNPHVAHEYLGLTAEEAALVAGAATGQPGSASPGVWNLWGFAKETLDTTAAIPDPLDSTRWISSSPAGSAAWLNVLTGRVDVFLQQSSLSYLELLALLGCFTLNPVDGDERVIQVVACQQDDPATCAPDKLRLDGFGQKTAAVTARFIRLWRALGWSPHDLDRVVMALGSVSQNTPHLTPAALDDDLLVQLAHVLRLHRSLGVPLDRLAAWFASNLDDGEALREWWTLTYRDHAAAGQPLQPSLYDRLFRNRSVVNPLDPVFTEDPKGLSGTLAEAHETITAALGISTADLTLLLADTDAIPATATNLTLAGLAELHRHVGLAKALKLSVRDYLALLKLTNARPFASTLATVRFVERLERLRQAGFSIAQLDYLLRHEFTKAAGVAPTDQQIAVVLNDLRTGLQAVAADNAFVDDPADARGLTTDVDGELTASKLALLNWDSGLVAQAIAMLADTAVYEADLAALPQGLTLPNDTGAYAVTLAAASAPTANDIPASLAGVVYYDTEAGNLCATRTLTTAEQQELVQALLASGDATLQAAGAALLALPAKLRGAISYDAGAQKLRFVGVMSSARLGLLQQAASDATDPHYQAYQDALDELHDAPRDFTTLYMTDFGVASQDFSVAVPWSLAGIVFPQSLEQRVYYDDTSRKLHFVGVMSAAERTLLYDIGTQASYTATIQARRKAGAITAAQEAVLLGLSTDNDYLQVIDALYAAPRSATAPSDAESITAGDRATLFDGETEPGARFVLVLGKLLPYLCRVLSERLVKQKLSEAVALPPDLTDELLTRRLTALGAGAGLKLPAVADFLAPRFVASSSKTLPDSAAFPHLFRGYLRLHKIAMLLARCRLTPRQAGWLFSWGDDAGWLDLTALPLQPMPSPPTTAERQAVAQRFEAWERLTDLVRLRDALPVGETLLAEVLAVVNSETGSLGETLTRLCAETAWDESEAAALLTGGLGFTTFPDDYRDGRALLRLVEAFTLLKRLGMPASQGQLLASLHQQQLLLDDTGQPLTDALTLAARVAKLQQAGQGVVQAARSKYDEDRWLQIVKPLRDVLREQQRAALVAYLVTHPATVTTAGGGTRPAWRDVYGLFAHHLIDVEMSPCQLSSRIKQATGSVQLFVQRCLTGLEPEVVTGAAFDSCWHQWTWMKRYRVWEANRKVFLYPENWIEPELRDDKSPFFEELESELLQADLSRTPEETDLQLRTGNPVETAFTHYLEKLDEVARLEIVGEYHQQEKDASGELVIDLLHVFGRTRATPHVYFYRRRVDRSYWTAWEKVDLDIEGDHLIPVVWNRRLYLFWPIFTEKQEETTITMPKAGGQLTGGRRYLEIQLAWSQYLGAKWDAKRITKDILETPRAAPDSGPLFAATTYAFKAEVDASSTLTVSCVQNRYGTCIVGVFGFKGQDGVVEATSYTDPSLGVLHWVHEPTRTELSGMMFSELEASGGAASSAADDSLYLITSIKDKTKSLCSPASLQVEDKVLASTPGRFELLHPHQYAQFLARYPFFFQDETRTFFVTRETSWTPIQVEPKGLHPDLLDPVAAPTWLGAYLEKLHVMPDPRPPIQALETALATTGDPPVFAPSFPVLEAYPAPAGAVDATAATGTWPGPGTAAAIRPGEAIASGLSLGASPTAVAQRGTALDLAPSYSTWANAFDHALTSARSPEVLTWWLGESGYRFRMFYHPYVWNFVRHLNRDGVPGLLQRPLQMMKLRFFKHEYEPTSLVVSGQPSSDDPTPKYPRIEVDFSYEGAYSLYNWELFFHVPLLIADRLGKEQRFAAAQKWFHYIFDPTDRSDHTAPQKYWQTKPFFETTADDYWSQSVPNMMRWLAGGVDAAQFGALSARAQADLLALPSKIAEWRKHPFRPHLVARLRTTAYQKTVVMKYLDNLVAWGDQLFRRDTIESVNEATQLYVLAAEILGARPQKIPPRAVPEVQTYRSMKDKLDEFSNVLAAIEDFVPPAAPPTYSPSSGSDPHVTLPAMLYFCIPKNDKLLGYWDTVADRLFKIRHCMNIEGVVRQLPLFEPPIDPALLVKAVAAGIDLSSALADVTAALPRYRFATMAQKAGELCAEVNALGGALLAALEKRDAEALSLLRSTHEIVLLKAARSVKEQQITEAEETLEGLQAGREVVDLRHQFYAGLTFTNPAEERHLALVDSALGLQEAASVMDLIASILCLIPDAKVGCPTTIGVTLGGSGLGGAMKAMAGYLGSLAGIDQTKASMAATMASHQRRWDEWKLQESLAAKELEQIDKQIAAAQIRAAIAEQELKNHDRQLENAQQADEFMRDKFTSEQLYSWMVGQIAGVYFQSYQLAYDVAKRAERAFRHELGLRDSSFVQFGYWDSLKKGLLAGERLHHDLKRMEVAYLAQHRREYELTRHVSLRQLDPVALIQLRETGSCTLALPEALFDLDCPGHYLRRIKSVGLTIPCVVGPYSAVHATLTLLKSSIRHSAVLAGGTYARDTADDDPRFTDGHGSVQSIVTSGAQNDSGLFEVNLRDERYLPFEGAGAISEWRLELPASFRQFDYDTISDVILHLRYTAREGGAQLRQQVTSELRSALNEIAGSGAESGLVQLLSLRHDFSNEFHQLAQSAVGTAVKIDITDAHLPLFLTSLQGYEPSVSQVAMVLRTPSTQAVGAFAITLDSKPFTKFARDSSYGSLWSAAEGSPFTGKLRASHTLTITNAGGLAPTTAGATAAVDSDVLSDIFLVVSYTLKEVQ